MSEANTVNGANEQTVEAHINTKFSELNETDHKNLVQELLNFLNTEYVGYWQQRADRINASLDKLPAISDLVNTFENQSALNELIVVVHKEIYSGQSDSLFDKNKETLKNKFNAEYSNVTSFIFETKAWDASNKASVRHDQFEKDLREAYLLKIEGEGKEFLKNNMLESTSVLDMCFAIYKSHKIEPSSHFINNLLKAIDNKDVNYLISVVGFNENVASRQIFTMITGKKILASSTEKNARLVVDQYCAITPEMRFELNAQMQLAREIKVSQRDAEYAWKALSKQYIKIGSDENSKRETMSSYIQYLVASELNTISNLGRGSFGLTHGLSCSSVKFKPWNDFLKNAIKLGGIEKAIALVSESDDENASVANMFSK